MQELFLKQIMDGDVTVGLKKGLVDLMKEYMALNQWPEHQIKKVCHSLEFLQKRARGEIPTGARFLRDLVLNHPEYKHDSIITPAVAFDIMNTVADLEADPSPQKTSAREKLLNQFA